MTTTRLFCTICDFEVHFEFSGKIVLHYIFSVKCIHHLLPLYIICKGNRGIAESNVSSEDYLMSGSFSAQKDDKIQCAICFEHFVQF